MVFGVCREMALVNGGGDTFNGEKGIVLLSKRKREQRPFSPHALLQCSANRAL